VQLQRTQSNVKLQQPMPAKAIKITLVTSNISADFPAHPGVSQKKT
jgi:hypothetical protein